MTTQAKEGAEGEMSHKPYPRSEERLNLGDHEPDDRADEYAVEPFDEGNDEE
ncbi:MAG: hypothetical protein AAF662_02815 [Pseudomonadota bacterium]